MVELVHLECYDLETNLYQFLLFGLYFRYCLFIADTLSKVWRAAGLRKDNSRIKALRGRRQEICFLGYVIKYL